MENNVNQNEIKTSKATDQEKLANKKADALTAIAILMLVFGKEIFSVLGENIPSLKDTFNTIGRICPYASVALIIFVVIKYPKNKNSKDALFFGFGGIALYILIVTLAIFLGALLLRSCIRGDLSNFG